VQRFLGSIEIIENRLSDVQSSVEIDSGFEIMDKLRRSVFVDSVSYHYPKTKNNVLKDITIKFDVNSITAIVGPSGGGKSTLIDLLPSLRVPTKGSIYFDGVNIKKYTLKSIREKISYAPQTPQIFNGTIKSHILYGKPNATHEEVVEAAHLAGAKGFISQLPEGFETILDEGAVNLSGGQKQRLDLARVLIKKSPILILDEPTSNLDAETEKAFRQVLRNIRKKTNTLIVIVAHRLASISDSDRIIVLNQGVVESFGTHSELLNCNEWYAKAWQTQGVS
jgi:ABC-type multidrug transport system fused ATPase/permease subunit